MRITGQSNLEQVAAAVADALREAGIRAVLNGGACASIYSAGEHQSENLDLILQSSPTQRQGESARGVPALTYTDYTSDKNGPIARSSRSAGTPRDGRADSPLMYPIQ